MIEIFKVRVLKNRFIILPLVGAAVGLAFVFLSKCSDGTCFILGNPFSGMLYGALLGLLIASG